MSNVIQFPPQSGRHPSNDEQSARPAEKLLEDEAREIEAFYGENAYSAFLRKHRRRPNRDQAATIGKLLCGRVKADDGSMQPPLSDSERRTRKKGYEAKLAAARLELAKRDAQTAVLTLADKANAELASVCITQFSDLERLRPSIESALGLLQRFAAELQRHEQTPGCGSRPPTRSHSRHRR